LNAFDGLNVLNELNSLNYMIALNGWNLVSSLNREPVRRIDRFERLTFAIAYGFRKIEKRVGLRPAMTLAICTVRADIC